MRENLLREKKQLFERFDMIKKEREELGFMKRRMEHEFSERKRQHELEFGDRVHSLKESLHRELVLKGEKLRKMEDERLKKELERKEKELKGQLGEEYQRRFRAEIAKREVGLEKRKRELEKHIMNQAKRLFQ